MHRFSSGKSRMKDVGVLFLVAMQRILRDKTTFFPVVMVANFANALSAVVIFLIGEHLWPREIAVMITALYLGALWPYQIVLHGGFQLVSQLFCLCGMFVFFQIDGSGSADYWWAFLSGVSFGLMIFASASSRKYIPIAIILCVYWFAQTGPIFVFTQGGLSGAATSVLLCVIGSLCIALLIAYHQSQNISKTLYSQPTGKLLQHWKSQEDISDREKVSYAAKFIRQVASTGCAFCSLTLVWITLFPSMADVFVLISILLGFLITTGCFIYPNFIDAIRGYFAYADMRDFGHFFAIEKILREMGDRVIHGQRASRSGWLWILQLLKRITPFHLFLILFVGCALVIESIRTGEGVFINDDLLVGCLILVAPFAMGEITQGPQIARAYYPGFLGIILAIGFFADVLIGDIPMEANQKIIYSVITGYLIVSVVWCGFEFFRDLLPSRMAVSRLNRLLHSKGIYSFCTIDSRFNHWFVDVLDEQFPNVFEIAHDFAIERDVDRVVILPGYSQMASNVVTIGSDPNINDKTVKALTERVKASGGEIFEIKNMGTSRFWVLEDEATAYLDLLLRCIDDLERKRAAGRVMIMGDSA